MYTALGFRFDVTVLRLGLWMIAHAKALYKYPLLYKFITITLIISTLFPNSIHSLKTGNTPSRVVEDLNQPKSLLRMWHRGNFFHYFL